MAQTARDGGTAQQGTTRRVVYRKPTAPAKRAYARELRRRATASERVLWECLRRSQLGARFRRQAPLFGYIADFFCAKAMLVIEVDGLSHQGREAADVLRDRHFAQFGVVTLRLTAAEVLTDLDGAVGRIWVALAAGLRRPAVHVPHAWKGSR